MRVLLLPANPSADLLASRSLPFGLRIPTLILASPSRLSGLTLPLHLGPPPPPPPLPTHQLLSLADIFNFSF